MPTHVSNYSIVKDIFIVKAILRVFPLVFAHEGLSRYAPDTRLVINMIYVFCLWFSLRLGTILISIFSAIKGTCIMILLTYKNMEELKITVEKFLVNINYNESFVLFLVEEFDIAFFALITFFSLYLVSCVLTGIGAFWCIPRLCYPFLPLQLILVFLNLFIYTVFFKYLLYLAFLLIDEQNQSTFELTEVISCLTLAIFYVFYEIYEILCVYSFIQVVNDLSHQVMKMSLISVLPTTSRTCKLSKHK
ncbi:uncharacterized protein [Euwallacea fornicatus]|uniref:uncharacterized protein n=1 Tax=Euwallacea fornicatus TaxID=995702 RepID=UPI00338D5B57